MQITVGKTNVPLSDENAQILIGSYGSTLDDVEAGLANDFAGLIATRLQKQLDDLIKGDVTTKIELAKPEDIALLSKFLDASDEQRTAAKLALANALK